MFNPLGVLISHSYIHHRLSPPERKGVGNKFSVLCRPGLILSDSLYWRQLSHRIQVRLRPQSRVRSCSMKHKENVKYQKGSMPGTLCLFHWLTEPRPSHGMKSLPVTFPSRLNVTTPAAGLSLVLPALAWQRSALDSCPGHSQPALTPEQAIPPLNASASSPVKSSQTHQLVISFMHTGALY